MQTKHSYLPSLALASKVQLIRTHISGQDRYESLAYTRRQTGLATVIGIVIAAGTAFAAGIDGKWTTTIDTAIGPMKWSYEFKAEGKTLTGVTADAKGTQYKIENGKIDGDTLSFVENANLEGLGPTRIENTGKIVSADEIRMHREVGSIASEDFVVKRVK